MIDERKVKIFKLIGLGGGIILILLLMFFWQGGQNKSSTDSSTQVASRQITDFLKTYFTKDKVGSNRKDYRPYLTEQAYQEEMANEEEPGFKVRTSLMQNFRYKSAKIYVGTEEPVVFATVTYDYDSVSQKKREEDQQKTVRTTNSYSLKLTYKDVNGKQLIDKIEIVNLNPVGEAGQQTDEYAPGVINLEDMNKEE
ncbi:hypothetical protein O3620_01025 [Streptococcus sp. 27098_8_134]|uniref:hypothetical protein n=1 Tax=Streptococcus sp. 27098_8_134 TaxID=3003644 RepID=UPI00352CB614